MPPWNDAPVYSIVGTVVGKNYVKGRPDQLIVQVDDEQGVSHTLIAYGRNAAQLDRFIYVHNTYRFDIGDNDYGQITIKGCWQA